MKKLNKDEFIKKATESRLLDKSGIIDFDANHIDCDMFNNDKDLKIEIPIFGNF